MATETLSLLEFIQKLINDADLRQLFADNPEQALADNGLQDVNEADVRDALVLVDDSQTADFSRDYHSSPSIDFSGANIGSHNRSDSDDDNDGGSSHSAAVEHLNRFITNNFVDDRDTTVDNSTNQQIDTGGGDFDQDIDVHSNVASGDGAVAAGGDISDSTITTGDGNVVGDGNVTGDDNVTGDGNQVVSGDGNTTSFGDGDANSTHVGGDLTVGDGGGFASGGDVTVDNTDSSTHDSNNDSSDNSVHDSGNTDVDASTHDSFNDQHETHIDDSFQDNSDDSDHSDNSTDTDTSIDLHN